MADTEFPYALYALLLCSFLFFIYFDKTLMPIRRTISLPLPTSRLASSALQTIEVDTELSPFVRRDLNLVEPECEGNASWKGEKTCVLQTTYRATTNRMLRVAVNGFMESLGVVLGVMHELDVDVLAAGSESEGEGED